MVVNNSKVNVLITAVGGRSVGYQILESLKLYRKYYNITVTDVDAFSPGLYEADKAFLLPKAKSSDYISRLLDLSTKNKIQVILPGSQPEVEVISKNENLFLKKKIIPIINPYNVVKSCFDKLELYNFLAKKNILIPKTTKLLSLKDIKSFQFPIVVKPYKDTSGSKNVYIVKDTNELSLILDKLSKDKLDLLAQEYVGSEDEEYTVGVVISRNGKIIDSIVMKRYLTGLSRGEERKINGKNFVLSTGYSQGFIVNQPDVKEYCEKVAEVICTRGPLNIQCRRTKRGVYIFEVHPRFSGSASMRAEVGFNESHYLIRDFLGIEAVKKIPHKTGYAIIRKFKNTVVKMDDFMEMRELL